MTAQPHRNKQRQVADLDWLGHGQKAVLINLGIDTVEALYGLLLVDDAAQAVMDALLVTNQERVRLLARLEAMLGEKTSLALKAAGRKAVADRGSRTVGVLETPDTSEAEEKTGHGSES